MCFLFLSLPHYFHPFLNFLIFFKFSVDKTLFPMVSYLSCKWATHKWHKRPRGQAVKTTPSHGVNPGSIPGEVIRLKSDRFVWLFSIFIRTSLSEKNTNWQLPITLVYLSARLAIANYRRTPAIQKCLGKLRMEKNGELTQRDNKRKIIWHIYGSIRYPSVWYRSRI